ncbi:hypothetical protein [Novipirellula artificiosorum]|uniref:Uncharacterized protein n=1 Tax=Novipirellula artificiosorum TaxID=2528016 RepID=A0A5C6DLE4_9BACT|nr:hypothetical protein [Novipirellula artificiosorum]TWU37005.1 hypothetical protein Poly41_31310 [Novipirellula artificiosorum]
MLYGIGRAIAASCLFASLFLAMGCTPRVIVRAHPAPNDNGIRYYRPKPYLKVEPAEVAVDKNQTTLVPGMVRISLAYLPDFSEEYAIDVRPGLGTASVGIQLEDGWNLTEISQDLDSQTDENLRAIGSVLTGIGDVIPTASKPSTSQEVNFTVPAQNVPIGFYESIVGRDPRGCKRLYGFRYVGFLPFSGCPVDMGGSEHFCCGDGYHSLYGLTFQNGQMVFQLLEVMATTPITAAAVTPNQPTKADDRSLGTSRLTNPEHIDLARLSIELRTYLKQLDAEVVSVDAEEQSGEVVVRIVVPAGSLAFSVQRAAEDWLSQSLQVGDRYDVIVEAESP